MARLNRAAEVLLNHKLREAYDQARSALPASSSKPLTAQGRRRGRAEEGAWFNRKSTDAGDWVAVDCAGSAASKSWEPGTGFEAFQRELRGQHGDRIVRFGARVQHWTRPHQRLLAGGLLLLGISLIVSLRPVTLGIGPQNARQPVTVSVQALLP
jgi:curved DNA-binding protein CbpA